MKTKNYLIALSLAAVTLLTAQVSSAQSSINFDDLDGSVGGQLIPQGYSGLNWYNFYALNASYYNSGNSGYNNGLVSGSNVAFNGYGTPATISIDTGSFNIYSGYFTAAWNNGLNINATASYQGTEVGSTNFVVDTTGPTLEVLNFTGIDSLTFTSSGGTDAGWGAGEHFALDNLSTSPIPEPSAYALFGLGALALVLAYRRKKSAILTLALVGGLTSFTGSAKADLINTISYADFNDTFSWANLGPDRTSIQDGSAMTSTLLSIPATVSTGSGILEVRTQPDSWYGNFSPSSPLLFNLGNNGITTIKFDSPVLAVGAFIQANYYGIFTGEIDLYDTNSFLIGHYTEDGNSSGANDGSAIFLGANANGNLINLVAFSTPTGGDGGFSIGNISVQTAAVPEPSTYALFGLGAMVLVISARKTKKMIS